MRPVERAQRPLTAHVRQRGANTTPGRNESKLTDAVDGTRSQRALDSETNHDRCLQPGIRTAVRERIRQFVIQATIRRLHELERARSDAIASGQQRPATAEREWLVLILDRYAMRVISAAMRLSDLLNEGVALVERLELPRERFPRMHAVYIMRPVADSLSYLCKTTWNDYAALHVYFTLSAAPLLSRASRPEKPLSAGAIASGETDSLEKQLRSRLPAALQRRLATSVELDMDLMALDERYFSLDRPFGAVHRLYRPDQGSMMTEIRSQVDQLVSLCCTLGARPIIRYTVDAPLAKWMARQLDEALCEHPRARNLPFSGEMNQQGSIRSYRSQSRRAPLGLGSAEAGDPPTPWTLLLADRSYDPLAPVLHEFSYQAMVMDILAEEMDRFHAGGARIRHPYFDSSGREQNREMVIDDLENDSLFRSIRFHHMGDAIPALTSAFQQFLDTNPAARLQMSKAQDGGSQAGLSGSASERIDLKQLGAAIRSLPQYREQLSSFSLHTYLAGRCMRAFRERHLELIAGLEQDLACGRDLDGHRIRREALEQTLLKLFPENRRPTRSTSTPKKTETTEAQEALSLPEGERTRLVLIAMLAKYTGQCESAALFDERMMMQRAGILSLSVEHLLNGANTLVSFRAPMNEYAPKSWWKRRQWRRRERKLHRMRMQQADVPYTLSRYVPAFYAVMQDFADGHLRASEWPLVSKHRTVGADVIPSPNAPTPINDSESSSDSHEEEPSPASRLPLRRSNRSQRRHGGRWRSERVDHPTGKIVTGYAERERNAGPAASNDHHLGDDHDGHDDEPRSDDKSGSGQRAARPELGKAAAYAAAASGSPLAERGTLPSESFVERTPRLVIFVAGGISYSEARAAAQVMNRTGQDIIIGGSSMLVPTDYMRAIQALDEPEEAARLDLTPVDSELAEALKAVSPSDVDTEPSVAEPSRTNSGVRSKGRSRPGPRGTSRESKKATLGPWLTKFCGACFCLGHTEPESVSHPP
ncbi:vacuolar sorting protein VPS33/slp1 [Cyanidiococcus yangmingshanensis]|uniref:Vacuolar sorting protein VPS33/slp1 n=1 Tax=Cyanidiococcus yangmingshanensis TaxID=2690220 RepID=A0A7J7IDG1_9RHOD|nr:vacuolar sorting protein VPS33/slp1 [Cyanidiococcus yangmingshanensis]